ncbi:hypothetical protein DFH09DRAFT_1080445 [Mycena vulgaris]|nr:hypothetical protein DFH09DRAFT_1080445 [Mycena vulgaris]
MPSRNSTDTTGMTARLDRKEANFLIGKQQEATCGYTPSHKGRATLCTNSTPPATQILATTVLDTLLNPVHLALSNNPCYRSFGGQSPMGRPALYTDSTHPAPRTFVMTSYMLHSFPSTSHATAIHATRLPDSNPTRERLLELHPSGDKLTRTISLQGTRTTTTHNHHTSPGCAIMDYAHSIHAHTRQGYESPPTGGFSLSGHKPETRVATLAKFRVCLSREWPSHQGYNRNVRIRSPNDMWMFWKEGTHGSGARRLCEGDKYKSPMKSLQYSSSELALLILVAFTKRTPSYADTPSCSSGNLVKAHLENRLQPPKRTKATPLAIPCILVDVEAICGVSHLADPSPRSLAHHKGESIGVEKKQRL